MTPAGSRFGGVRWAFFMTITCVSVSSQEGLAQAVGAVSAGSQQARVITGVVRSTTDQSVVAGATLDLTGPALSRRVRTDEKGVFRFGQIPRGTYRLLVLRLGFAPLRQDVTVDDSDAELTVSLTAEQQELNAVITRANVTAVYGGIGAVGPTKNAQGEKLMTAVAGAKVHVLGARKEITTDSLGRFFIELSKPARYIIRVTSPGLATQLYTVDVPRNRAVDASRLLDSVRVEPPAGREYLWGEMDRRIGWRAMGSALISGGELRELGGSLSSAVERSRGMTARSMRLGTTTCVFVNGIAKPGFSLDAIRPEEIEAIELYSGSGDPTNSLKMSWPSGALCGDGPRSIPPARSTLVAQWAAIWTVR